MTKEFKFIGVSAELHKYLSLIRDECRYSSFEELIIDNLDSICEKGEQRRKRYDSYVFGGIGYPVEEVKPIQPAAE